VSTKRGERLKLSGSLSYTRMRELFLQKLQQLGYDSKQFSLHSLRAGGATSAANAGVPDCLFKRHGRWKSESAKDGYIKDSENSLVCVQESQSVTTCSLLPYMYPKMFSGCTTGPKHSVM